MSNAFCATCNSVVTARGISVAKNTDTTTININVVQLESRWRRHSSWQRNNGWCVDGCGGCGKDAVCLSVRVDPLTPISDWTACLSLDEDDGPRMLPSPDLLPVRRGNWPSSDCKELSVLSARATLVSWSWGRLFLWQSHLRCDQVHSWQRLQHEQLNICENNLHKRWQCWDEDEADAILLTAVMAKPRPEVLPDSNVGWNNFSRFWRARWRARKSARLSRTRALHGNTWTKRIRKL